MNIPAQIANVVIAVMLCAGSLDQALAGPVAASSAAVAMAAPPPLANAPASAPHARAYLFRGALGPIFSRGMDRLTERLEQAGINADVYEFTICRLIAETAMREYRRDPAPIILIGHSMGGYCALKFAEVLQAENIPVSLVVTVDPAHVAPSVPLNVERYINIFLSKSVLGGGDVKPEQGYRGDYASFDLSEQDDVTHINIDKMDSIHQQIVAKTVELATMPAKAGGETAPIRYVVPPHTAIELWDSGIPVVARSGDTLQKLATLRNLPLWSLTQINRESDSAALVPGQRIIIPHHLTPLAAVTAEAVSASAFKRKPVPELIRGEDRFASRKRVKAKI
jgi:predicted alpha/beta-hydrolase family hydrolase